MSGALPSDRASRPTAQAPAGLGDTATIPSAVMGRHIRRVIIDGHGWGEVAPERGVLAVFDGRELVAIVFGADERQELARARLTAIAPELSEITAAVTRLGQTNRIACAHGLAPLVREAKEIWDRLDPLPHCEPMPTPDAGGDLHTNDCPFWDGLSCNCRGESDAP